MGQEVGGTSLVIAGVSIPLGEAVDALLRYPRRTPRVYDLTAEELQGMTPSELLRRTRKVSSRLSAKGLEAMVSRGKDAPWDERLAGADLADLRPGDEVWAAADALYLHFLDPKIDRVGFAKVHKYLHLVYPAVFPILDSKVRQTYGKAQRVLAAESGLKGGDHWRRRTWLAVGADVRSNRESSAFEQLRSRLDSEACGFLENDLPGELQHVRRLLSLGDLRLLDMLTWKVHTQIAHVVPEDWSWASVSAAKRVSFTEALPALPASPGVLVLWSHEGQVGPVEVTEDMREWVQCRLDARIAGGAVIAWFPTNTVDAALQRQDRLFAEHRPALNPEPA